LIKTNQRHCTSVRRASAGFGSVFSTAKHALEYPGRFLDDREAVTYFIRYFNWHDTEHCHSGIDFVTPQKANNGQRQAIVGGIDGPKLSPRTAGAGRKTNRNPACKSQEPRNINQPKLHRVING
jgi:hypothetical protein